MAAGMLKQMWGNNTDAAQLACALGPAVCVPAAPSRAASPPRDTSVAVAKTEPNAAASSSGFWSRPSEE